MGKTLKENLAEIEKHIDTGEWEKALNSLNSTFKEFLFKITTKDNLQLLKPYQKILASREEVRNQQEIETAYQNIGLLYFWKGNHGKALEYFHKLINPLPEKARKRKAELLNTIGVIHSAQGELDNAMKNYQTSLALSKEVNNPEMMAITLCNLGDIYALKGEFTEAIDYYQKNTAKLDEFSNKTSKAYRGAKAYSLLSIGKVYAQKGDLDKALECYEESLILYEGFETQQPVVLFQMIQLFLDQQDLDRARLKLKELQKISDQYDDKHHTNLYARLAQGLILKYTPRDRDKFKALEIFQEIAEEEVFIHELMVFALLNYCDLLLFELQTFGNEETLSEAQEIIRRLIKIAESQNSYWLLSEVYLLQSKFALLELDTQRAQILLNKSYHIAKEKKLGKLTDIISQEQQMLTLQVQKWKQFIQAETSIKKRIELSQLENLIDRMIYKRLYKTKEEVKDYLMIARQLKDEWEAEG